MGQIQGAGWVSFPLPMTSWGTPSKKINTARSARASRFDISAACLPENGATDLEKLAREAKADEVFLRLLKQLLDQGRNVTDKPTSRTYAPREFAAEAEAKSSGIRKAEFETSMRRLFDSGKIHVEMHGPRPSRQFERLALK